MSDFFALVGTIQFENAKKAGAWRRAAIPSMATWERAHREWLRAGAAGQTVGAFLDEATARDDGPFFLRVALDGAQLNIHGYLGEDLPDWLGPLVGALRKAAPSATGELTVVGVAGAPSARLVLEDGKARFSDDDVGLVDAPAAMAAVDAARRGEVVAALAPAAIASIDADEGDTAIFAQLLFPMDGGKSGRKWAASTVAPAPDLAQLRPSFFDVAFPPQSPLTILADVKALELAPSEWLEFDLNNHVELKLQALLGRSCPSWLPLMAATVRSATAFGAEGHMVVLPLSGTMATVVELRKKAITSKEVDEKALGKFLGWPLRKTYLQERAARAR